ncbi:hypothetical protein [Longimicrobium terrae]|nr:hypothetical protein [Longimicrobium terrae]
MFLLTVSACDREPPQNTPMSDRVLDLYSPQFRFGEPMDALKRGGSVRELAEREGHATMHLRLKSPRSGLEEVRVLGTEFDSPGRSVATDYVFFSTPEKAREVSVQVRAELRQLLGVEPRMGCSGSHELGRDSMLVWEQPTGGGAALMIPELEPGRVPARQITRLVVFPHKVYASNSAIQVQEGPCR